MKYHATIPSSAESVQWIAGTSKLYNEQSNNVQWTTYFVRLPMLVLKTLHLVDCQVSSPTQVTTIIIGCSKLPWHDACTILCWAWCHTDSCKSCSHCFQPLAQPDKIAEGLPTVMWSTSRLVPWYWIASLSLAYKASKPLAWVCMLHAKTATWPPQSACHDEVVLCDAFEQQCSTTTQRRQRRLYLVLPTFCGSPAW